MFDIGVTELIVVAVMALVILGPEKLPLFFRTMGTLISKAQSYVSDVKNDIEKQIELEDFSKTKKAFSEIGRDVTKDISCLKEEFSDLTIEPNKETQLNDGFEKKIGFFIGSTGLTWPEENSYIRLRDRLRERNRQRLSKKRKL